MKFFMRLTFTFIIVPPIGALIAYLPLFFSLLLSGGDGDWREAFVWWLPLVLLASQYAYCIMIPSIIVIGLYARQGAKGYLYLLTGLLVGTVIGLSQALPLGQHQALIFTSILLQAISMGALAYLTMRPSALANNKENPSKT